MRILHVAPHLGGGVGRFLSNVFPPTPDAEHAFLTLEGQRDAKILEAFRQELILAADEGRLFEEMGKADVVQLEWWNHPLTFRLLTATETFPPARILLFSHTSGFHPPSYITKALVGFPDLFVVATPYSLEQENVARARNVQVIHGLGGCRLTRDVHPLPHEGFNVTYIGTVDYTKIHPAFVRLCSRVGLDDARFVVCSNDDPGHLRAEAEALGTEGRFDFRGKVDDVAAVLAESDVFGYPLNPRHFGTGEQALLEAMGAGVPPVVFENGAEAALVRDGETGVVVPDEAGYVAAVEHLHDHPDHRRRLGERARAHALEHFCAERTSARFGEAYERLMAGPKRARPGIPWHDREPSTVGARAFLAALGRHGEPFLAAIRDGPGKGEGERRIRDLQEQRSPTKGSVKHYRSCFPDDPYLNWWSGLVWEEEGNTAEAARCFERAAPLLKGKGSVHGG